MSISQTLAEEVAAACAVLRDHDMLRSANRLERTMIPKQTATGKGKRVVAVGRIKGKARQFYIDPALLAQGEVISEEELP